MPEIDKQEEFDKSIFENLAPYGKDIPYKKMIDFLDISFNYLNSYMEYMEDSLDYTKYKDFEDLKNYVNSIPIEPSVHKSVIEKSSEDGLALIAVLISKLLNLNIENGIKFNPKDNINNVSEKTHYLIGGSVYYGTNINIWPEYSKYVVKESINDDFLKTEEFYREASTLTTSDVDGLKGFLNYLKNYEKIIKVKLNVYEQRLEVLKIEPSSPYSDFRVMVLSDLATKCERMLLTITKVTSDLVNYDKYLINYIPAVDLIIDKLANSSNL